MDKPSILFLCTANCCRSQMAEGLMRRLAGKAMDVQSAGATPIGFVHPIAIESLAEIGIDISRNESKGLGAFRSRGFDYVVTVCDGARGACPALAGTKATYHWPLADPATTPGSKEKKLRLARSVREELGTKLRALLEELGITPEGVL